MSAISMKPIGSVRSPITEVGQTEWADIESEIHLDLSWIGALQGLGTFSHIQVVFYLDRASFNPQTDTVRHPRDRADIPERGVFATSTQYRPNLIGVTVVQLLSIDGNLLVVKGLDALDGTPVLDIKPYLAESELEKQL